MSDSPIFGFNCTNPECGKLFKMRYPGKPGYFKVTCPHCGEKVTIKMPDPKAVAGAKAEDVTDKPATPPPPTGAQPAAKSQAKPQTDAAKPKTGKPAASAQAQQQGVDNSGKLLDYTDYPGGASYFLVGERAIITCPHCHQRKLGYTAQKESMPTFTCPGCKGKIRVWFQKPTVRIDPERVNKKQGKLVHVRPLWLSVDYALPLGVHTIGRADMEQPSSISIKGDSSMSRRSASITATMNSDEGFRYRLKVLNATNPVIHCGRALTEGEEVYLNFGDEIRMGHTLFRFVVDEKAPRLSNF